MLRWPFKAETANHDCHVGDIVVRMRLVIHRQCGVGLRVNYALGTPSVSILVVF